MMGCNKCTKIAGVVFLILGVVFLLRDFDVWTFWNIQWWTALFLVMGVGSLASANCPDCRAMKEGKKK